MPSRRLASIAAAGIALLVPTSLGLGASRTDIGTEGHACTLRPGADCRDAVQPWRVEDHGNVRRVRFQRADLRGADFRGADLRRADFRGARLRYADLRGANLTGARFSPAPRRAGPGVSNSLSCLPNCSGADLEHADLTDALLTDTDFAGADLSYASLVSATATHANFSYANFSYANVTSANFCNSNMYGIITTGWTATDARIPPDGRLCPSG